MLHLQSLCRVLTVRVLVLLSTCSITGESPPSNSVGWLMGATPPEHNSMLLGTSPGSFSSRGRHMANMLGSSPRTGSLSSSLPIPKFQHPSHSLLEENGFKQMKWVLLFLFVGC